MRRPTPDVNLNLNVRGMGQSATVAANDRARELIASGRPVARLGLGQSPFPVPDQVVTALRQHAAEKDYLPVKGLPALREAIAENVRRRQGVDRSAEDVLIGPGSKELMFLLQMVYYGDLVIPTPAWVSYAPQARILGRRVEMLATRPENGWRLMPEELERLCSSDRGRPRILILNYPSNPTGGTYRTDELRALARVAREHRVVLLSDEIYGELHHRGQHVSISRFYPEGTIVSDGLSKWCGAGGWRLGAFVFPRSMRWLLDAMAAAASETYTSTSAPIQWAAITGFRGGVWLEDYLARSRRVLSSLGRWISRRLNEVGIVCERPAGAFYLFPDFSALAEPLAARGIRTSRQLCDELLEQAQVVILPGSDFGRDERELSARVAYVDFDGRRALEAARDMPREPALVESFLREHCRGTVEAIERIAAWARRLAGSGADGGHGAERVAAAPVAAAPR